MRRFVRRLLIAVLVLLAVLALGVRLRYGGGDPYEDLTGPPLLAEDALEVIVSSPEPIGNVAVSADDRLFFTIHPESRPDSLKLVEWVDGRAVPWPDAAAQALLETPLGVRIDRQNRLWVIDHGHHGFGRPRLLAFDLATGAVARDIAFEREAAPLGSFLNDIAVDARGRTVYVADVSFFRRQPAIIVVDVASGHTRRILEGHRSVTAQDWLIRTASGPMQFLRGAITLKAGVDGIALSRDDAWLFYAAMNHTHAYKLSTADIHNAALNEPALAANAVQLGRKPLSDGLSTDAAGNLLITDVEHGAILRLTPDGRLQTLIRSARIRWADGLSFGPDGWLYLADSAMPDVMLRTKTHMRASAPFHVYRFRPGTSGVPGH